jgi:NADH-dependent peroxiredoxin subunit C
MIFTTTGGNTMRTLINSTLPEFKVQAYHREEFKTITDKDLAGKWSVLFFYPADFTFVCPTELADLAEKHEELKKMGVEVFSISTDTHFTHKAWHDTSETIKKINYPMLADPTGHLSRAFGVYMEEEGLAQRGTFLIDPDGKVKLAEVNDDGIGRNADELLRKVQAAQFVRQNPNQACPAKWKPGAETLKPGLDLVGKI